MSSPPDVSLVLPSIPEFMTEVGGEEGGEGSGSSVLVVAMGGVLTATNKWLLKIIIIVSDYLPRQGSLPRLQERGFIEIYKG